MENQKKLAFLTYANLKAGWDSIIDKDTKQAHVFVAGMIISLLFVLFMLKFGPSVFAVALVVVTAVYIPFLCRLGQIFQERT